MRTADMYTKQAFCSIVSVSHFESRSDASLSISWFLVRSYCGCICVLQVRARVRVRVWLGVAVGVRSSCVPTHNYGHVCIKFCSIIRLHPRPNTHMPQKEERPKQYEISLWLKGFSNESLDSTWIQSFRVSEFRSGGPTNDRLIIMPGLSQS